MKKVNGKLKFYYLGDSSGDKILDLIDKEYDSVIEVIGENVYLSFNASFLEKPANEPIKFDLNQFTTQFKDVFLFLLNIIKISEDEFLLIADFVWMQGEEDANNFEIIGRYEGDVPKGLKFRECFSF